MHYELRVNQQLKLPFSSTTSSKSPFLISISIKHVEFEAAAAARCQIKFSKRAGAATLLIVALFRRPLPPSSCFLSNFLFLSSSSAAESGAENKPRKLPGIAAAKGLGWCGNLEAADPVKVIIITC
ncbi:OLC1v1014098C1 [Oldenlandia corymbosa var. corymbosa]|uniref:OLC1v1014098C1 n=1 Tax=Oldenlandia corymbosa var. corymbosa TaxID=529605 RepID=A0AAV1E094_OLDCO|nr:OLC1v1014098C1 [Oldenlandia corymbosa var. corymbosa]